MAVGRLGGGSRRAAGVPWRIRAYHGVARASLGGGVADTGALRRFWAFLGVGDPGVCISEDLVLIGDFFDGRLNPR